MDDADEDYVAPQNAVKSPESRELSSDSEEFSDDDGVSKRTRSNANSRSGTSKLKGPNGYSWEDEYQMTWDIVKGDDSGEWSLESVIQTMIENRKKKIMKNPSTPFQRGIIRTLIVIIDASSAMSEKELRPTKFSVMLSLLQDFITEFFDQNPISQMGIVMMRNGVAHLVSEVNGSPQFHLDKIRNVKAKQHNRYEPKGDPSLQNSLEMARSLLMYNFGNNSNNTKNSKEILIIFGALFTSDPGDIHKTIDNLVKDSIRVKVIGLSAQVAICSELVNKTNKIKGLNSGSNTNYGVILNEAHFRELLMDCVIPLPVTAEEKQEQQLSVGIPLIKMGFPSKIQSSLSSGSNSMVEFPRLCACHPTSGSESSKNAVDVANNNSYSEDGTVSVIGYQCPQCKSKVCHLPTICPICGLMLILSTHLARSYHHLVPLGAYLEVPVSESYNSTYCYGCLLKFPEGKKVDETEEKKQTYLTSSRYKCQKCLHDFCIDCDVFIHETLHNCPGCEDN